MKITPLRTGTLLLVMIFAASIALGQRPRPTPRPPAKAKSIIFNVTNDGKSLEPIAYVERGKLVEATYNPDANKSFVSTYYKTNTPYTLVFGGANDGKATVTKSNIASDCAKNMAHVKTQTTRAKLKGIVTALATNMKVAAGPGTRRPPTAAERTEIEKLVKAEFTKQKVSAASQKDLRYHNLTALDVNKDGKAELVGSYWLAPNDKERHLLFFIAEKNSAGKYVFGHSEYSHVTPDKVMTGDVKDTDQGVYHELLIDVLDYDNDGTSEIFTVIQAFEGNNFHAFRKQGGKWVKSFEAYNYRCAF